MPRVLEANFAEVLLFPPCVEDWVPAESAARYVRAFVEQFEDEQGALDAAVEQSDEGRPPYSLSLLLRVWLYGYVRGIRSSRKLERACCEHLEFIWLSGNLRPDHNTLWRFWSKHRMLVGRLFKHSVKVAIELKMVGFVLQAIDGTKIQAASGGRGVWDRVALERLLAKLDQVLAQTEEAVEAAEIGEVSMELPTEISQDNAQGLREKVAQALQKVRSGQTRHCHPQETEARRMQCDGRNRFGYNAQAVVDGSQRVVVAAEVVASENDTRQLTPMAKRAEEISGAKPIAMVVDGGYGTGEQLQEAEEEGFNVLAPINGDTAVGEDGQPKPGHSSQFRYDHQRREMICPRGERLRYVNQRLRRGVVVENYRARAGVCRACPAFGLCTKDIRGRMVQRWPWSEQIEEHREKMADPVHRAVYGLRSETIEPVFGWVKSAWGFRRWTFRGLDKIQAQWQMICTATNLRALLQNWKSKVPVPAR